jgi:LPXTG-motif cell wall-anchored protein
MNGTVTLGGTTFDNAQAITLGIPGSTISGTSTPASGVINGIADTDGSDIVVKNYEKSIFPLTGGIGIVAFVVAGIMAMAAALYKRKKDMARRD